MSTLMAGYFAWNALMTPGPIVLLSDVYQLSWPPSFCASLYRIASRCFSVFPATWRRIGFSGLGGVFAGAELPAVAPPSAAPTIAAVTSSAAARFEMRIGNLHRPF